MKRKLVELGVPEEEIEDIHDHDSDRKKMLLFERVNKGQVRIIMGSTEKLGTGVNIQAKLKTLHHIDAPWRPSDMEQREGRMLRQGNENPVVEILRYGVDRSFDANAYQRLDTKERFIRSVLNGTNTDREAEDTGGEAITSFADAFAAISGNPLVRERFNIEMRIRHLERLESQFEADQSRAREHLRRARADAELAEKTSMDIRKQAALLQPQFVEIEQIKIVTTEGAVEGKEPAFAVLDGFIRVRLEEVRRRLEKQLSIDRNTWGLKDRRESVPAPDIVVNGLAVHVEAQIQYRATTPGWPERILDPEIRYWFKVPSTDLWKSGHVTTGRGLAESVYRKVAELEEDAKQRERLAETKRRQMTELAGLQNRQFTHAEELLQQRRRLEEIKKQLENLTSKADAQTTADEAGYSEESLVVGDPNA
ncbi:MAG TPA: helicase-related protein [Tepidisphaeraceae bacterium]|nr:helicase-related protein [Tepidisphaeraceae bacterium]